MVAGRSLHSGINTMYTEAFDFFCVGGGFVTHGSVGIFMDNYFDREAVYRLLISVCTLICLCIHLCCIFLGLNIDPLCASSHI